MTRLSCCFCIMASLADLILAAQLMPELYARYVETERRIGPTFVMPRKGQPRRFLEEVTGIKAARPVAEVTAPLGDDLVDTLQRLTAWQSAQAPITQAMGAAS